MIFRPTPARATEMTALIVLALLATTVGELPAQEPAAPPPPALAPTNLPLKTIAPGVLDLGLVRLDKQSGSVTIPAFVNLKEGVIEYFLVTSEGKTHESVLRTDAEPLHIHVAMLLLGARGAGTNELPADPALRLPGDKVTIESQPNNDVALRIKGKPSKSL